MVEVALALLILSIGLLTVVGLFASGMDSNRTGNSKQVASFFADEILNGFVGVSFTTNALPNTTTMKAAVPQTNIWESSVTLAWTVPLQAAVVGTLAYFPAGGANIPDRAFNLQNKNMQLCGNRKCLSFDLSGSGASVTNLMTSFYMEFYNYGMVSPD